MPRKEGAREESRVPKEVQAASGEREAAWNPRVAWVVQVAPKEQRLRRRPAAGREVSGEPKEALVARPGQA